MIYVKYPAYINVIIPPSTLFIFLLVRQNTNIIIDITDITKISTTASLITGIGCMVAETPNINNILKRFEPMAFPTARSFSPFLAATTEVTSSGRLVPHATIVRPIKVGLMPIYAAITLAPFTTKSPPNLMQTIPIIMKITAFHHFIGALFSSSLEEFLALIAPTTEYAINIANTTKRMIPSTLPKVPDCLLKFAGLNIEIKLSLLGKEVLFIEDVCGPAAIEKIRALKEGEILLLDNVRFVSEEQTLFEMKLQLSHEEQAKTLLVRKLAPLADYYVCDAFAAAHRDQPSLCGFEQVLPSAMGRLFEKEYVVISELMEAPKRPCTFVLGGAKISDAFLMMETVLKNGVADHILTGGLVANIMLLAKGESIGQGSYDFIVKSGYEMYIDKAKEVLQQYASHVVLPVDLAYTKNGERMEAALGKLPQDVSATDIGKETAALYQKYIRESATVFVNGPMGIFEEEATEYGTRAVWEALGDTGAYTVVGGGDSITATTKYEKTDQISYICTGGGALIRFLTGEELPVVKALRHGSLL